jgi:hypothetical protein
MRWRIAFGVVTLASTGQASAGAGLAPDAGSVEADSPLSGTPRTPPEIRLSPGPAYRFFGGLALGRGVRFNNPYRLQTELGDSAESLSVSAPYTDLQLGVVFDAASTIAHGVAVHGSIALAGIPQEVLSPSYVLFVRLDPRWALVGRAGLPIVIEPDVNVGFEAGGGGVFYLTSGLGMTASLVGSLFYGAATFESSRTAIPMLSLEAGLFYDYEVLP